RRNWRNNGTYPNLKHEENPMSTDVNLAKHALHDKLESQIKTIEAKLDTLKARAETAKANVEVKAIAELLTKKPTIQHKLQELRKASVDQWEKVKVDLETRIADFEKSVHGIESKIKAH